MKLNSLHAHFGAQSGTITVTDPFGMDPPLEMKVRRTSYPPYVRSLHEAPQTPAVAAAIQQIAVEKLAAGEALDGEVDVQGKVLELLKAGEITLGDLNEPLAVSAQRVVDHLLVGWSGLTDADTGEAVPFTPAAAIELLTYREEAGENWPGKTVGEVLVGHLLEKASEGARVEAAADEAAAKNSERSSAGSSSGATATSFNGAN